MRKSLVLTVVGLLLLAGLGVAAAQLAGLSGEPEPDVPGGPTSTVPGIQESGSTAPEPPVTSNTLPPEVGSNDTRPPVPASPNRPLIPNEPVPDGFSPTPKVVQARSGMVNLHRTSWDRAEVLGERKVRLYFVSGVEPCTVLNNVAVEYGGSQVVITLFEGNDPATADLACIMIAQFKAVDVLLDQDLGGRMIVDGAD